MDIHVRQSGDIVILDLRGSISIDSDNLIGETNKLVLNKRLKMLFNLENVDMIDYYGLTILSVAFKNILSKDGKIKFFKVPLPIEKVLELTRLNQVFEAYSDEETAIKSFATDSGQTKPNTVIRFNERVDIRCPIHFSLLPPYKSEKINGQTLNLSATGVFIHTEHTFPVSAQLRLTIELERNKMYIFSGKVVWIADKELQRDCYPGMGIQFINVNTEAQRKLIEFINKEIKKIAHGSQNGKM